MKKVLRYELDDFLIYINENDSVYVSELEKHVQCNIVCVVDGEYKVLINNYLCSAVYTDNMVIAFRNESEYLDPVYYDIEKRCTAFNDKKYALGEVSGFIDELYILGMSEVIDDTEHNLRLETLTERINSEDMSTMEKVELLMDNFEEEKRPFFK